VKYNAFFCKKRIKLSEEIKRFSKVGFSSSFTIIILRLSLVILELTSGLHSQQGIFEILGPIPWEWSLSWLKK
jgi:hypothetical protein